jgi:hypothetical protein
MQATLLSFLDGAFRGKRPVFQKSREKVAKLKSDPDVRCFLRCLVQPITMVSEVVPGAAAEKAKFVSSLVYCALVLVC